MTYSRLNERTVYSSGFSAEGDSMSALEFPPASGNSILRSLADEFIRLSGRCGKKAMPVLLFDTHNYDKTEAGISLALFCSFKSVVKVAICNWINDCAHIAPGVEIRVGRQGMGYSGLRLFLSIVA